MKRRPLSVTIISALIAAAGAVGFAYHLTELDVHHPLHNDIVWVSLIRVIAIVAGVYMLRGSNWARWLALGWIAFHVVVSAFHTLPELAFHCLLFATFAYLLLRRPAAEYFVAPASS